MFSPSLSRAVFNATAFALTFASWAVWNVSIWDVFAPLDGDIERRSVATSLVWAFLVGGCLSLVANRLLSRLSSNAALSILATVATAGALVAHCSLNAEPLRRVPALVGLALVGVGFYSLVGRLYARTFRDLATPDRFPAIFVFATLAYIAAQAFARSRFENSFAISATFTAILAVLALVGPRSNDEAERAAPSPSYFSLVRRNPLFWATVFVASCFGSSLWFPIFGRAYAYLFFYRLTIPPFPPSFFSVLHSLGEIVAILAAPWAIRLCGGPKRSLGVALLASALSYAALNGNAVALVVAALSSRIAYVGVIAVVPAFYVAKFYRSEARRQALTLLAVATLVLPAFFTTAIFNVIERTSLEARAFDVGAATAIPASILAFIAVFWLLRGAPVAPPSADDDAQEAA